MGILTVLFSKSIFKQLFVLTVLNEPPFFFDLNFGNPENMYAEIEELINNLNLEYDKKYLFQTDLYYDSKIKLSYEWRRQLKKGISFLNKITILNRETFLEKFIIL